MRLWEDGFDHYGNTTTPMLDNSYGNADGTLSTAQFVTGTHSFIPGNQGLLSFQGLRKVLPTAETKVGMAARFYWPSLPAFNYENCICGLMSGDSRVSQLSFFVDTNGAIRIVREAVAPSSNGNAVPGGFGFTGTLIATTDPLVGSAGFNHIEIQAYLHVSAGWVRIAINGVHRYAATGLNTLYDATNCVSVAQYNSYNSHVTNFYMEDYYIYDFTGNSAVDTDFCPSVDGSGVATSYIGELQVWPLFPNGDTASAAWAKSTGTVGYSLINSPTPDDTTYIDSTTAGDLSEFDLDDLPVNITYIQGLGIHGRLSKSDAGAAMVQQGMKSVAATSDAAQRPVTTIPTYWTDQINVDPNSSARWTRTSLNAAKLRLTRSV